MRVRSTKISAGALRMPSQAQSLMSQVAWFNRLRFGAVIGMVVTIFIAGTLLGKLERTWTLYAMAGCTLAVNLLYLRYYPRLAEESVKTVRRHVDVQIGIDLVILTALLHFSGGVTNPLVLFYLFHTFIAALLLSVRAAAFVGALSLALVSILAFFEYAGWLPHHPIQLGWIDLRATDPLRLTAGLLAFAATIAFSVYFVSTVVRQLRAREEELVNLSRQLAHSEKLASVGTLAAGVSHEINNPVGVIQNKAKILRYRIEDGDSAEVLLSELDTIDKHTRRIEAVTAGLLAFSRSTPFELRELDFNDLVREVVDLVRVPFDNAAVKVELELVDGPVTVRGSANHLLQVLVNVLLNARDASAANSTVWIATFVSRKTAGVRIRDVGHGIAPEHADKVFDPFFTTKDVDKGTGLGLAISHGIIERHGGAIDVESELGEGTTFTIELPTAGAGEHNT